MQPASKVKKWATEAEDDTNEPPLKIQAIEVPEAESDEEYESVPKKSRKSSPKPPTPVPVPQAVLEAPTEDEPMVDISAIDATDDDWLRSRTNRVLDLMDPEDITPAQSSKNIAEVVKTTDEPIIDEEPEEQFEGFGDEDETPTPDLVRDAIAANGRLFVRNLPYTATEEDLRKHFEPYGSLEEVCIFPFFRIFLPL